MSKVRYSNQLSVALYEPRIPQNTGNIARTCAAFHIPLILIKPLGFSLEDRYLRRAGLDYWPFIDITILDSIDVLISRKKSQQRVIGCSKSPGQKLNDFRFKEGDIILLGREDNGLPDYARSKCEEIVSIPMRGITFNSSNNGVRSLNLSVACGIITFHAGNQLNLW